MTEDHDFCLSERASHPIKVISMDCHKSVSEPNPLPPQAVNASLNQDDVPTQILGARESEPERPGRSKEDRPVFRAEWHDAKEIVVPFDASKSSVQLVDEKEWAAAYATKRLRMPAIENLSLEARQTVGKVERTPGLWDNFIGFLLGLMLFAEILLIIWTIALLHSGFPLSKWLAWSLAAAWALAVASLKILRQKPVPYRLLVWLGSGATTLAWTSWSPWSDKVITRLHLYFLSP